MNSKNIFKECCLKHLSLTQKSRFLRYYNIMYNKHGSYLSFLNLKNTIKKVFKSYDLVKVYYGITNHQNLFNISTSNRYKDYTPFLSTKFLIVGIFLCNRKYYLWTIRRNLNRYFRLVMTHNL